MKQGRTEHGRTIAALLDPARLCVAGALIGVDRTSEQLAAHTGLDQRAVLHALGELRQAGLVDASSGSYTLRLVRLRELANEWSDGELPMDPYIGYGMTGDEHVVLSRFFRGIDLVAIPKARAQRLIVLERLALEFDLGRHYVEREVNEVLRRFHLDVSTLRRYLVDEDFLDRDGSTYWRSGGRPNVPEAEQV